MNISILASPPWHFRLCLIFLSHTLLHLHFYPFIYLYLTKALFILTHFFEEEIINHYHHHYHYHYHYLYHLLYYYHYHYFLYFISISAPSPRISPPHWSGPAGLGRVRLKWLGLAGLGRVKFTRFRHVWPGLVRLGSVISDQT